MSRIVKANAASLAVLDPIGLPRRQVIEVDDECAAALPSGSTQGHLAWLNTKGDSPQFEDKLTAPRAYAEGAAHIVENAHFRLTISDGRISSLVDRQLDRELILAGTSAVTAGLMLYDDLPLAYDAWDAEIYHLDMAEVITFESVEVLEASGPLRASLRALASFGKSRAELTVSRTSKTTVTILILAQISLDATPANDPTTTRSWVRIEANIDFHEKHKFLKCECQHVAFTSRAQPLTVALPIDIHCSYATYGTQYGLIERPTHRNTTLDQAKFEVCGHQFADLSEAGYGVAIASDYKYGYAVEGNVMR